jgi:hypothetical protein
MYLIYGSIEAASDVDNIEAKFYQQLAPESKKYLELVSVELQVSH